MLSSGRRPVTGGVAVGVRNAIDASNVLARNSNPFAVIAVARWTMYAGSYTTDEGCAGVEILVADGDELSALVSTGSTPYFFFNLAHNTASLPWYLRAISSLGRRQRRETRGVPSGRTVERRASALTCSVRCQDYASRRTSEGASPSPPRTTRALLAPPAFLAQ